MAVASGGGAGVGVELGGVPAPGGDFSESINGLAAIVEHELGRDPFASAVYVFGNRRLDRIKILGWNRNGFWLLHKRLKSERFVWLRPRDRASRQVIELTVQQFHWLLEGINLAATRGHEIIVSGLFVAADPSLS